uniref:Endonuclease domain-containing 1 protein n=1 Tax=Lates calcarifer TaxID=8187 RepID=A0A4W6CF48_LATCA
SHFVLFLVLFSVFSLMAKVVTSVSQCAEFFLQQTPPYIPEILKNGNILDQNRYKPICQTLNDTRTFVTLYDTTNKIPVFSAYKYRGNQKRKRPANIWKIEPQVNSAHMSDLFFHLLQLEDRNGDDNMQRANDKRRYNHQAGNTDYKNQGFDRGHLLPSSYGFSENDKESTFTLTNVVPQEGTFNKGSWNYMEQCVRCVLDKYCINNNDITEGFVVIGAKPSDNDILNNRINIPSMLWSAFCCYSREKGWLASAHWGENIPDINKHLQTKTLAELHAELGGSFSAFPGTQSFNNIPNNISPHCYTNPLC